MVIITVVPIPGVKIHRILTVFRFVINKKAHNQKTHTTTVLSLQPSITLDHIKTQNVTSDIN